MKVIKLKKLKLENFKGIKLFEAVFNDTETNIYGDNGTGKTTILDAFIWLLFDKNSADDKQFSIKTLDSNNEVIHKLDHMVEAILDIDGVDIKLRKRHREKWQTKRGQSEEQYVGNENEYFVNDVPFNQTQFNEKITSICNERIFKSITNTNFFFSLDWKKQREILFSMIPMKTDIELMQENPEYSKLLDVLIGKDIDGYAKELAVKQKKLKEELAKIPSRISEVNNSIPTIDYTEQSIKEEIAEGNNSIAELDLQLQSEHKRYEELNNKSVEITKQTIVNIGKGQQIFDKCFSELKIEYSKDINRKNELKSEINSLNNLLEPLKKHIGSNLEKIAQLEKSNEELRNRYNFINEEKLNINEAEFCCPICNRLFEESDIATKKEDLQKNFNLNKVKRTEQINQEGIKNKEQIELLKNLNIGLQKEIDNATKNIAEITEKYNSINATMPSDAEIKSIAEKYLETDTSYQSIQAEIKRLKEIPTDKVDIDTKELEEKKKWFINEVAELNKKRGAFESIDKAKKRIIELEKEARDTAQLIANIDREEFLIEGFIKYKIDMIEQPINNLFSIVKFKMFKKNINGGEEPCCIATSDGVPFTDLNTAKKVNCGIDIINVISNYNNIYAPIFIDSRESVSEIIATKSQIINLIVDSKYKSLTIL